MITAADVETAIENPAPEQVDLLLDFEWLVPTAEGEPYGNFSNPRFPMHYLFTAAGRLEPLLQENRRGQEFETKPYPLTTEDGWQIVRPMRYQAALDRCELLPVRGREVFERIAARGDYHEILINPGCGTYDEPNKQGAMRIACGGTRLLCQGIDPRPATRILPARSIAEIHRVLRQFHGVVEPTHRLEYLGDKLVAVYEGLDINQKPRSQAFELVPAMADPLDYGPGVSEVLCGANIAYMLDFHVWTIRHNFHPGTREGLHPFTSALLRETDEVLKMLDPIRDELPPRFFLTEFSASFVKTKPQVITGDWLREARALFLEFLSHDPQDREWLKS